MRVWDERYRRDMRRYNLAVRLIGHEARTSTICIWTGLSEERIRTLYRWYLDVGPATATVRHRGPSPRRISYFFRSPQLRSESAAAAILCRLAGAVPLKPVRDASRSLPSVSCGERVCDAYEGYLRAVSDPQLTLEHFFLLVLALGSGEELALGNCTNCDAAILVDLLGLDRRICDVCRVAGARSAMPDAVAQEVAPAVSAIAPDSDMQRSLF